MVKSIKPLRIPVIGRISPLFIVMIILTVLTHLFLYRTKWGLRMRMVGENPAAASSVGIPVRKMKYIGATVTGLLSGLAGSYLSVDLLNMFVRDMSAGRGYMAICANVLGRYTPIGAFFSSMLFGFAEALQIALQGVGFPNRLVQMLPYVVTLIVLTFAVRYVRPPRGMLQNVEE